MRLPVFLQPFPDIPPMTESLNTMLVERAPENDTRDVSTFSAASMFGVLITLITCLLLQPQGNLIVKKPSNVFGRTLFFFLRLDPVVCIVEAASILHALVLILMRAIRSCHGNVYRDFGVFITNLNAGAAGLLFLRSHTALRLQDTDPQLNEKLVGPVPQRGHIEMVLDAITLLSVAGTAIKLIASVVPRHFQIISWSYIGGWIVVQLAVMISHCGPSKELLDPKELLRSAEYLQQTADYLELMGPTPVMIMFFLLQPVSLVCFPLSFPFVDPFGGLCYGVLVPLLVGLAFFIFLTHSQRRREASMTFASLLNLLGTIATIAAALVCYEEEGTFKPEWLDWLG